MQHEKIKQMLTEANKDYSIAMEELSRPSEDMVQMAVCLSVKDLLAGYLRAYLLYKGVETSSEMSASGLLKQCKALDNDFREISLSPVICRAETGEVKEMYCLSAGRIQKCFDAAKTVRKTVMEKIKSGMIDFGDSLNNPI